MKEIKLKAKTRNPKFKIRICLLLSFLFIQTVYSQTFGDGYYRLTTQQLGEVKSLDVVNDGANNKVHLTNTGNFSGQYWKITALGNGFYRLTTQWLGNTKSLDVVNDGVNDKLQLANTGNASGQFWKFSPVGNGYYRLTTRWLGDVKSLDVVNDGTNTRVRLAETGDFSGQYWKITSLSGGSETTNVISEKKPTFKDRSIAGFKVLVNSELDGRKEAEEALEILSERLGFMAKIVDAKHWNRLKKVPFWIQYKLKTDGAMWYHPNKDWLTANGYGAELEKSVEIKSVRNFIDWQGDQPMMVLHELAHAFEDLYLGEMKDQIANAYKMAVAGGKYESVPYVRGGKQRAYALNNKTEYFAELTEAYFGRNDYYPFDREQLKEFDPEGYKLMQQAWK